ncbi:MAG: hypothetical protein ABI615_11270 [Chthoniobacterales bacterium]
MPTNKINWTLALANFGKVFTGLLTVVSALPQSPVAQLIPSTYQPYVVVGSAVATALLQATSAHQETKPRVDPQIDQESTLR